MTTQDRFVDYGTLPTGIPRVLHQFMLGLNTAMPGEVVRYDAATRRADVRGQLALVLDDRRADRTARDFQRAGMVPNVRQFCHVV